MSQPQLLTVADALAPMPPIQWMVEGLFSVASTSVTYGAPGAKKTWSMLDMAVCVALGQPWLGRQTTQGAVLIVDEESGPRRLLRRLGDVVRGHLADASLQIFATSLHGFNFFAPTTDKSADALKAMILQLGARLVIIDALADVMLGGDENAVKDTQKVFHALRQVAESTGAAVNLIHHANKVNGYRGSTAIAGAIDLLLEVESKQADSVVKFETTKARDTEPTKFQGECHWQPNQFWMTECTTQAGTSTTHAYTKGERAVMTWLLQQPTCTGTNAELERVTGYVPGTVRNLVSTLVSLGVLRRTDGGAAGTPGTYAVDPLGLTVHPL